MKRFPAALALTASVLFAAPAYAQQQPSGAGGDDPKTTLAYSALVIRKAAVESQLAAILDSFAPQHPNVHARRFELGVVEREMEAMAAPGGPSPSKLTAGFGKLILRKIAVEVELRKLLEDFTPTHPNVKNKRVELDALEREIADILC